MYHCTSEKKTTTKEESRKLIRPHRAIINKRGLQCVFVYLLTNYWERQAHKGTRQILSVHLIGYSFQVILLPCVLLNLKTIFIHKHKQVLTITKKNINHTKSRLCQFKFCFTPIHQIRFSSGIIITYLDDIY